jgi:hypothetical protein
MMRRSNDSAHTTPKWLRLTAGLLAVALFAAACGDSDEQSSQDKYCEAGDSARASLDALLDVDLIATGTDGVQEAFDTLVDDVGDLRSSASDAVKADVEALETAIEDGKDALSDAGGDLTAENISNLVSALAEIETSAVAVFATLSDCS